MFHIFIFLQFYEFIQATVIVFPQFSLFLMTLQFKSNICRFIHNEPKGN